MNKKNENFIKKLKFAMLENGLNQVSLAKKLGLRSASVSKCFLGENNPKISTLEKIAKVTNKPVNYFFDNSTEVNGSRNNVFCSGGESREKDLEKEIQLIKKELEVHRYRIENLELRIGRKRPK